MFLGELAVYGAGIRPSRLWKVPSNAAWSPNEWCLVLESLGWFRGRGLFWACSWRASRLQRILRALTRFRFLGLSWRAGVARVVSGCE